MAVPTYSVRRNVGHHTGPGFNRCRRCPPLVPSCHLHPPSPFLLIQVPVPKHGRRWTFCFPSHVFFPKRGRRWNFRFPSHVFLPKRGRRVTFRFPSHVFLPKRGRRWTVCFPSHVFLPNRGRRWTFRFLRHVFLPNRGGKENGGKGRRCGGNKHIKR